MKRFKYSLLCSAMALACSTATAATYEVVDVGGVENTRESFALGVNGHGDTVGISRDHYNFPIDFDHLDMALIESDLAARKESSPSAYENIHFEDIQNRQLNADALGYLFSFLNARKNDLNFQKIGDQTGFATVNGFTNEVSVFDQVDPDFGGKSRSTVDRVNAINDSGWAVASGTDRYVYTTYTPDATEDTPEPEPKNTWVTSFLGQKGVVSNGEQKTVIHSPETRFGGTSYLADISNSNYVVGYAAIGYSALATESLASCETLTDPVNQMRCAITVKRDYDAAKQRFYKYRAFRWQLDGNMQVVEQKQLDLLFTPKEDDQRTHLSIAYGVNNAGHVVGYSEGFKNQSDFDNNRLTREIAVYWDGETVREFIDQEKDQDADSRTLAVNDNNIAVGFVENYRNFDLIKQMFIYDATTNKVTYPDGFFSSSESVAYGINNHNKVVGIAEVENSVVTTRRKRGFVYDIASDTMTDLNTLIACDSPYTIAEARDINDDGVIVGTAIMNVQKRDSLGNVLLDDNGDPIMNELPRAVKLVPIAGGSVENCTDNDSETPTYDRKGAGFGWVWLLGLLPLIARRRLVG